MPINYLGDPPADDIFENEFKNENNFKIENGAVQGDKISC